jgi:hypothetical protein
VCAAPAVSIYDERRLPIRVTAPDATRAQVADSGTSFTLTGNGVRVLQEFAVRQLLRFPDSK